MTRRWCGVALVMVVLVAGCSADGGASNGPDPDPTDVATTTSTSGATEVVPATDAAAGGGSTTSGEVDGEVAEDAGGSAAGDVDPAQLRDGQRLEDIGRVYDALRSYFSAEQAAGAEDLSYPRMGYEALASVLVPAYLDALPHDPNRPGNYYYVVTEDGWSFGLGVWFESSPGDSWTQSAGIDTEVVSPLLDAAMGPAPTWDG